MLGFSTDIWIPSDSCEVCCLAKNRELTEIELIAGGEMKILRESPISAGGQVAAGSLEPAQHHTFGHCLVVMEGRKSVWNLTKEERHDLFDGDYQFMPAGDVHQVAQHEDTEFFISWDGKLDIFFDEDPEKARKAVQSELTLRRRSKAFAGTVLFQGRFLLAGLETEEFVVVGMHGL